MSSGLVPGRPRPNRKHRIRQWQVAQGLASTAKTDRSFYEVIVALKECVSSV
jgi:hypothetical protein